MRHYQSEGGGKEGRENKELTGIKECRGDIDEKIVNGGWRKVGEEKKKRG